MNSEQEMLHILKIAVWKYIRACIRNSNIDVQQEYVFKKE